MQQLLQKLQQQLGYTFADRRLLLRALTHRSFGADHNERLEFLGDSVLGLCVAQWLFEQPGAWAEGDLSRVRANLVCQDALHQQALQLGLPAVLRLSEGEARSGGAQRASILADAVEALIGAVFLEGGFDAAQALVRKLVAHTSLQPGVAVRSKDAKTALQEWLQARRLALPVYDVVAVQGAAHQQHFEVRCQVPGRPGTAHGTGTSRRAAEQQAAAALLQQLQEPSHEHPKS